MSQDASFFPEEMAFFSQVQQALESDQFERLILSQYKGPEKDLEKISCRVVQLQGKPHVQLLLRYTRNDVTQNYPLIDAISEIQRFYVHCKQANLLTTQHEVQVKKNKKKAMLTQTLRKAVQPASTQVEHDRTKHRFVQQTRPFLQDLGITDKAGNIVPSMARKWKQINKFVEILAGAVNSLGDHHRALKVVDFGSGKGYLTFALYDYLASQGSTPYVTGVELSDSMVAFCQQVAEKNKFTQLDFFQGDVRTYQPEHLDVMIALHACDVATDFAIHSGIRLGASVIMCAPCCHKELRPQMRSPDVLKPMLQFGIHTGQQAEMLTDTIRALLLKAYGYETKVFEFVALEHTSKNKMILATRRHERTTPDPQVLAQIEALKTMYGIQQHSLELLLNNKWDGSGVGEKC